jgi:hypothetical protein
MFARTLCAVCPNAAGVRRVQRWKERFSENVVDTGGQVTPGNDSQCVPLRDTRRDRDSGPIRSAIPHHDEETSDLPEAEDDVDVRKAGFVALAGVEGSASRCSGSALRCDTAPSMEFSALAVPRVHSAKRRSAALAAASRWFWDGDSMWRPNRSQGC